MSKVAKQKVFDGYPKSILGRDEAQEESHFE